MATGTTTKIAPGIFSRKEIQALRALRKGYSRHRDLFSTAERARLDFLRWLNQAGQLEP